MRLTAICFFHSKMTVGIEPWREGKRAKIAAGSRKLLFIRTNEPQISKRVRWLGTFSSE